MKLRQIEKDILKDIQKNTPFSWAEVLNAYEITQSFDGTLRVLYYKIKYADDLTKIATYQYNKSIKDLIK